MSSARVESAAVCWLNVAVEIDAIEVEVIRSLHEKDKLTRATVDT